MSDNKTDPLEHSYKDKIILMIDDDPANLQIVVDYLEVYNFQIITAQDGKSGLERAKSAQPDLILLDVMMPGIDGFETCRRLKADEVTKDIPVLFMTALAETDDKLIGFQTGAVDYISKPIHPAEILARVSTHLRIRDLTRNLQAANQALAQKVFELEAMQEQLIRQERLAVLGQLAGGVGHELRNPLGVISNAVYFLQMVLTEADPTVKEYLEIIASRVYQAEKIVVDLLDFSRIRSAVREKVAISELVTEVLAQHPSPKDVTVTTHIAADLPFVFVDHQQIGQVLANLVTNAYQAMPNGGELRIRANVEQALVQLAVTDTGRGMSSEMQEKIFEPLFTTKAKGIGLGLAVSKNLIDVNGGKIDVESIEGQGTTFTITLPMKEMV